MFAAVIKKVGSGFVGKRGDAVRPSSACGFLYDHLEIKRDRKGYLCRLGMFMQDARSEDGNGHMGLNIPDFGISRTGIGIIPDFLDEAVADGFVWQASDFEELSEAISKHSEEFYEFWGNPENCIDFLCYEQGERAPKNIALYLNHEIVPHKCATNAFQLGLLYAYLGHDEAAEREFESSRKLAPNTDKEVSEALLLLHDKRLSPKPDIFPFKDLMAR